MTREEYIGITVWSRIWTRTHSPSCTEPEFDAFVFIWADDDDEKKVQYLP